MGYCLFSDASLIDARASQLPHPAFPALPSLIQCNVGPPHSFLVPRRRVLEAGLFDRAPKSCEDWDLWLRLALLGLETTTVPRAGAYYRQYAGSMSTNRARMLHSRAEVLLKAHRTIVHNIELLSNWGKDLFEAENRVYRRCMVQGADRHTLCAWNVRCGSCELADWVAIRSHEDCFPERLATASRSACILLL